MVRAKDFLKAASTSHNIEHFFNTQTQTPNANNVSNFQSSKRSARDPADLYNIDENDANLKEICRGINAINEKLETMQNSLDNTQLHLNNVSKKSMQNELKIENLNIQTDALRQRNLNDRIEISGPLDDYFTDSHNIKSHAVKFLKELMIEIESVEIANAYMKKLPGVHERKILIIIFIHDAIKSRVMKRKMSMKTGLAAKFFFNESLTPHNRNLLYHARQMKKDGKFAAVGSIDGKIFVKKASLGQKIFLNSVNELNDLARLGVTKVLQAEGGQSNTTNL